MNKNSLFTTDNPFALVTLPDLASKYLGEEDDAISLAGFQRNAVWREKKVQALWDSLLCRFPIGSLLLARYGDFSEVGSRPPQLTRSGSNTDTVMDDSGATYIVVDGQQRLNAIALGFAAFKPGDAARLWVDLAVPRNPEQALFDFYLCTYDHPFGPGLTKDQRRVALYALGKDGLDLDSMPLQETYPVGAVVPVPVVSLCAWLKDREWPDLYHQLTNGEIPACDSKTQEILRRKYRAALNPAEPPGQLLAALRAVVVDGQYRVPVILVEKQGDLMTPARLGKLFERVNTSGEVPPQADMFYSALKLRAPQVNNYVAAVYNEESIGRLLRPTDIVLNAIRLVNPQTTSLSLPNFKQFIENHFEEMLELLKKPEGGQSRFQRSLSHVYQALHHTGQPGDIGMPRQLLSRLRGRVWQTATYWVHQNFEQVEAQGGVNPANRLALLQYAMLDLMNLFVEYRRSISSYVGHAFFATLVSPLVQKGNFPAQAFYEAVRQKTRQDGWNIYFPTPNTYFDHLQNRFENRIPWVALNNEMALLVYAQRDYLEKWETLELDNDHILPQSWMYFRQGRTSASHFWRVEGIPNNYRGTVIHYHGNRRYWPGSLNRSYRDRALASKYIQGGSPDQATDTWHQEHELPTVGAVLAASFIPAERAADWAALAEPGQPNIWTTERFMRFKQLTDERRWRIYQHVFQTLNLGVFLDRPLTPQ